jgi:hypothetical protein
VKLLSDEVTLKTDRDRYRSLAQAMDWAGDIASGQGEHGLANGCWALASRFKKRQTELNTQLCKLQNPNYPGKKDEH